MKKDKGTWKKPIYENGVTKLPAPFPFEGAHERPSTIKEKVLPLHGDNKGSAAFAGSPIRSFKP